MKKIAVLIIGLLVLLPAYLRNQSMAELEKWRSAMVWVNYQGLNKSSGFFVSSDGIVVLPWHLVGYDINFLDGFKVYVQPYGENEVFKGELLAYVGKPTDIILVKINYKPKYWFDEFATAKVGMRCLVMGFPLMWTVGKEGRVIGSKYTEMVGVDVEPFPGSSGSAVISLEPESFGKILMMGKAKYGYLVGTPGIIIKNCLDRVKKQLKGG